MLMDAYNIVAPIDFIDRRKYDKLFLTMKNNVTAFFERVDEDCGEEPEEPKKETLYQALKKELPIWRKSNLTLDEAAVYSGIGVHRLRKLTDDDDCDFVVWVGSKRLIKREKFDAYIAKAYSV